MPKKWLRFTDLEARGLVRSWPALKKKVRDQGFPPGVMLGPNTRAWDEAEIEAWEADRPTAGPEPRGAAKVGKGRPRKKPEAAAKAAETVATT